MRGAHPVAVRDGGETLHVGADEPGDDRGLGVAQLGKLGGHVRHRAVVLTELAAGGDRGRVGSVTFRGQCLGESLRPRERVVAGLADRGPAALLQSGDLGGGDR